jgi:peptidoglycan/LPS O-acetylase OafA/YrhL
VRDILHNRILAARGAFPVIAGSQIPAQLGVVAVGVGVSYAAAFVSWHLFEKRVLALKRFFPYERQGPMPPQPVAEARSQSRPVPTLAP